MTGLKSTLGSYSSMESSLLGVPGLACIGLFTGVLAVVMGVAAPNVVVGAAAPNVGAPGVELAAGAPGDCEAAIRLPNKGVVDVVGFAPNRFCCAAPTERYQHNYIKVQSIYVVSFSNYTIL